MKTNQKPNKTIKEAVKMLADTSKYIENKLDKMSKPSRPISDEIEVGIYKEKRYTPYYTNKPSGEDWRKAIIKFVHGLNDYEYGLIDDDLNIILDIAQNALSRQRAEVIEEVKDIVDFVFNAHLGTGFCVQNSLCTDKQNEKISGIHKDIKQLLSKLQKEA